MDSLKKLIPFIKPYRKQSALALVLLTSVVFMELTIPRLIQRIIDQGITAQNRQVVLQTTLVMLGISLLSALFSVGNNILSVQAGESFSRDLREALFLKIQSFSFGDLDRLRTGQIMVRLTSDVTTLQRVTRMLLRIGTRAPLLMIGSIIWMVSTNAHLTLIMVPIFLATLAVLAFFISKLGPLFLLVQQKLDGLNTVLQENIAGVRVVKAFVRDLYEAKRFELANQEFTGQNIKVMQFMAILFPFLTALMNIGIVLVIWMGGLTAIQGDISIGEIVAFANYLLTTISPLTIMAMIATNLANGSASAQRVVKVLETIPEIQDQDESIPLPPHLVGRVAFEDVSFHYNGASDEPVLSHINLVAEPGETVAILGATGAGKSTLVLLIPRFYDVTAGRLTLDGIDIRQLQQDVLLAQVGVVLQETVLFSGSVRDNIRYGRPEASHEAVEMAARAAQAHDFITTLPQGYDTHIEARGVNLSGGQKQRIAIARALLVRPKILILDDSTSAVDVETETQIQETLEDLMAGCTSFVVAQRISTVLRADKILVIDKGQIAALGTHAELIQTSPIYQEIYESQLGNGITLN
jgi:ATP-binding cassette subfamily B multidrug efflux pump